MKNQLKALLPGLLISGMACAGQPLGLPAAPVPPDNPQSSEKTQLGKKLFQDRRFSADGSISCASCHRAELAFSDGLTVARGIEGKAGTRNTPSVINSVFYETLFVDGRAQSLEDQALGPLFNPIEHGLKDRKTLEEIVRHDADYVERFRSVFNIQAKAIGVDHVVKAIAGYERTLISGNSAFDRYLFGRDRSVLSGNAARGLAVFKGKGNCLTCHEISWNQALLTDNRFYNIGIGGEQLSAILADVTAAVSRGLDPDGLPLTERQRSELGRFNVSRDPADIGKFRTPTLRNAALTAPYMHDGSLRTLAEVIDYYDKGGNRTPLVDAKIFPLHLTTQEKSDLLAFLQALTGDIPD